MWSRRGALETTHSFINISRLRFSNRTHELRLRPCRGEAQKVFWEPVLCLHRLRGRPCCQHPISEHRFESWLFHF